MGQVVEHFPSKCEALSSIPIPPKTNCKDMYGTIRKNEIPPILDSK
jgi:hypothetical protein